jgi:hypothetical protein
MVVALLRLEPYESHNHAVSPSDFGRAASGLRAPVRRSPIRLARSGMVMAVALLQRHDPHQPSVDAASPGTSSRAGLAGGNVGSAT